MAEMRRGLGQLGVVVVEGGAGAFVIQMIERMADCAWPHRLPGGIDAATLLGAAHPDRPLGDVYYARVRDLYRAQRPYSHTYEGLGNALGYVGVHEFGHLAWKLHMKPSDSQYGVEYHDPIDATAYNYKEADSGANLVAVENGMGYWPSDVKSRLRANLGAR
jgi:hypothetical protein